MSIAFSIRHCRDAANPFNMKGLPKLKTTELEALGVTPMTHFNIDFQAYRGEYLASTTWLPLTTVVAAETPLLAQTNVVPLQYYHCSQSQAGHGSSVGASSKQSAADKYPGVTNIRPPKQPSDTIGLDCPFHYYNRTYPISPLGQEVDKNGRTQQVYLIRLSDYVKEQYSCICPHCGAMGTLNVIGHKTRDFRYYPVGKLMSVLREVAPVWRCSKCNSERSEPSVVKLDGFRVSREIAELLWHFLESGYKGSVRSLCDILHIDEHTGGALIDYRAEKGEEAFAATPRPKFKPKSEGDVEGEGEGEREKAKLKCNFAPPDELITGIMVDEIATAGQKYITHFLAIGGSRKVHFYAPGRGIAAIDAFIEWGGDMIADDVTFVADMNAGFISRMRKHRPNGNYVHDHFHHINNAAKHATSEFKAIATLLDKAGNKDAAAYLRDRKTIKVLLNTDEDSLSPKAKERFDKALTLHEHVSSVRNMYRQLSLMFQSDTMDEAEEHFNQHLLQCDQLQELHFADKPTKVKLEPKLSDYLIEHGYKAEPEPDPKATAPIAIRAAKYNDTGNSKPKGKHCAAATLGLTSLDHKQELLNYVKFRVTTGPMEGANNLLKVLKRASFGIKSIHRFFYRFKLVYEGGAKYRRTRCV